VRIKLKKDIIEEGIEYLKHLKEVVKKYDEVESEYIKIATELISLYNLVKSKSSDISTYLKPRVDRATKAIEVLRGGVVSEATEVRKSIPSSRFEVRGQE